MKEYTQNKLNLDPSVVAAARASAARVADDVQRFIDRHTTVSVERAVCRLLGVDGVDAGGVPLPNAVVDHIAERGLLAGGAALALGAAAAQGGLSPQQAAEQVAAGALDLAKTEPASPDAALAALAPYVEAGVGRVRGNARRRAELIAELGGEDEGRPLLYVIVATGNIYEDVTQARAAARQGADVIAVIRTTGQSLLDYVPYGATTEGFGGTYATQENFRIMRAALDEVGAEERRYIRLCNYCSGLCMPEIAAMGAFERLDVMLNDALYGILFRDINMQRTIIDQYFSRCINSFAGVVINTGEDNYLTTADAVQEAHTVLASQFLNEAFALKAGLREEQQGLGHAFEIDPGVEDAFVLELAQAQMAREIFPKAPLKYMPPTKFMTGNVFRGHVQDALFNAVTVLTGQRIHLLGMLTEAVHTPFMSDRALAIENARYIERTMRHLSEELAFKEGGRIQGRAREVLGKAAALLSEIERLGLFATLEKGVFADIRRQKDGGKGLSGVAAKDPGYRNPFEEAMKGGAAA